jgi:general secretion pathway protein H
MAGLAPRGFTLVELLVVVALIAIVAGVAALALGGEESRKLREETERLAALFRIAAAEARASGRTLAWEADHAGYWFRAANDEQYELREELARRRAWPFEVERIGTPRVLITREPLREPVRIEIGTRRRDLHLALDALGNLAAVDCEGARCAASR